MSATRVMTRVEKIAEVREQIDQLQLWFASRCYGFREKASRT